MIVENGSMPEGADSYCEVGFADLYLRARGFGDWPQDGERTAEKESALIRAADYLNGLHWIGRKAEGGRVMAWPRAGAYDKDGYEIDPDVVPEAVKAANAHLARLVLTGTDLQPILERGGKIQSETVGSLATTYFEDSPSRDVYSVLADLLGGLADEFAEYAGMASGRKGTLIIRTVL